jgi:predicted peroxiredoxin
LSQSGALVDDTGRNEVAKHFLVHITTGIENPSKATLALFVARAVVEGGHQLTLFFAADGVNLLRKETAENLIGLGTGAAAEHLAVIAAAKPSVFYSGGSAKPRGLTPENLALPAEPAGPPKLVALAAESDVVLSY